VLRVEDDVLGLDLAVVIQEVEAGTGQGGLPPPKSASTVSMSSAFRSSPVLERMRRLPGTTACANWVRPTM
jgi:hypothetical protein